MDVGDVLFKHWELIAGLSSVLMLFGKLQQQHIDLKQRVNDLEHQQDKHRDTLTSIMVDIGEIKGMTQMIYDQIKNRK